MKKGIITVLALLLLSFVSTNVFAIETTPTIVNGHVYGPDGKTPVNGASVKVTCDGNELIDDTNAEGFYVVEFFQGCDTGDVVSVESGSAKVDGTVTASKFIRKNLVYVNLSVPEFGTVAALIALVGSVAVFMVIRKRH